MERRDHTTQQHTTSQDAPQNSRWRRIRVFNRPDSQASQSPMLVTVMVILGIVALIVIGIIIF